MGRLGGGRRDVSKVLASYNLPPLSRIVDTLEVWSIPTMTAAAAAAKRTALRYWPKKDAAVQDLILAAGERAVTGDPERLKAAVADSDDLLAAAIVADPRLARRSQWVRSDEGEIACPALLVAGDDAPCFMRARKLEGQPNGAEPARVVISTDDHQIKPRTAAAFIATVRLVQQWRPVEIWWQGSWLGEGRNTGFVFHVPLVSGDMDFSRLEFCIADQARDSFSWRIMVAHACEHLHATWNGCSLQAESSYMPDSHFVSHHGIEPEGESIAYNAAKWLDWDSLYSKRWEYEKDVNGALQELPPPVVRIPDRTPEEQRKYEADLRRWRQEREQRAASEAKRREKAVNLTY